MANPDYLEFSLANTLDLLKLYLVCEEFPEYSENFMRIWLIFAMIPAILSNIPIFWNILPL